MSLLTDAAHNGEVIENPTEAVLQKFLTMGLQFLDASAEVWPEDAVIAEWKTAADAARASGSGETMRKLAIAAQAAFHADFKDSYDKLRNKDEGLFQLPLPLLVQLNAAQKWSAAHASVKSTVWDYLMELGQSSSMCTLYQKCPGGLMNKVTSMASALVSRVEKGEMGMNDINPMELSKQMLAGMDQKDLDAFGKELMSGGGDISGMMSMVQGMVGSMGADSGMPGLAGLMAGGGNMAGLAAMMGGGAQMMSGGAQSNPFANLRRLQ